MFKIISDNPKAFALAVAVHLLLGLVLSFSLDWNSTHKAPKVNVVQAVMIDDAKLRAEKEKLKKAEEKKRQVEETKRKKAEAEKKRKAEQERKKKEEQRKKLEAEKKRKADDVKRKAAEAKRKEELRKKQEAEKKRVAEQERKRKEEQERKRKEEEARLAEEQRLLQEQMAAEQARMDEIRQQELIREQDRYIALITQRVESKWLKPSGWRPGVSCKIKVRLVPGAGTAQVIDVQMIKSCGQPLFDNSVTTAVYNASPLPFPTDPGLIARMRDLNFIFKPEE